MAVPPAMGRSAVSMGDRREDFGEVVAILQTAPFQLGQPFSFYPDRKQGPIRFLSPNAFPSYFSNDSRFAVARQQVRKRFNGLDRAVRYGHRIPSI